MFKIVLRLITPLLLFSPLLCTHLAATESDDVKKIWEEANKELEGQNYEKAKKKYEEAIQKTENELLLLTLYHQKSLANYSLGDKKAAIEDLGKVIEIHLKFVDVKKKPKESITRAEYYKQLADRYLETSEKEYPDYLERAHEKLEKVLEILKESKVHDYGLQATTYASIAYYHLKKNQHEQAIENYNDVLETHSKHFLSITNIVPYRIQYKIAKIYFQLKDYKQAISFADKAYKAYNPKNAKKYHHDTYDLNEKAGYLELSATAHYLLGQQNEAVQKQEEVIKIRKESISTSDKDKVREKKTEKINTSTKMLKDMQKASNNPPTTIQSRKAKDRKSIAPPPAKEKDIKPTAPPPATSSKLKQGGSLALIAALLVALSTLLRKKNPKKAKNKDKEKDETPSKTPSKKNKNKA